MRVLAFICAQRWGTPEAGEQGITWIELLVIFLLHGGTPGDIGLEPLYMAQPKASLRVMLREFKNKVLRRVSVYFCPQDRLVFRPTKVAKHRLAPIAYTSHAAAVTGLIALSGERACHEAKCLFGLRHTFTRNSNLLWAHAQARQILVQGSAGLDRQTRFVL